MYRIFFFVFLFSCAGIFSGCNKKVVSNENVLYGTWIKGSNAGDTLQFSQKNGKNILTYNLSFNADLPAQTEAEYIYQNGILSLKNYLSTSRNFFLVHSFEWIRPGQEFKLQGSELFPFMSSTLVYFNYHKIP